MIIETGRLIVRTFREEDTDALYSIKTDPRVKEFCPMRAKIMRTVCNLSFCKQKMLHEYDLGWMMISAYTGKGYASEAAEAFAEDFCRAHGVDYLTVVMDTDNPASRRTAEKSGFRLFEKRTVYDYHYNRYCDDYYYFRRYWSGCTLKDRYYGDSPYYGRSTSDASEESCGRSADHLNGSSA